MTSVTERGSPEMGYLPDYDGTVRLPDGKQNKQHC